MENNWRKDSWRGYPIQQQPCWPDIPKHNAILQELRTLPALVFSGETRSLLHALAQENNFVLQVGHCAESFTNCTGPQIHDFVKIFLQMAMVIETMTNRNVIKIGRIAGQYAKPRTQEYEQINGVDMLTYRGDIINSIEPTVEKRTPNSENLREAYFRSAATLNLMRAFIQGGYSNISNWCDWNEHFFGQQIADNIYYKTLIEKLSFSINKGIHRIKANHIDTIFISHEALLLDYEEAFTRLDTTYGGFYDTSAHLVWIGERTRNITDAHIEFVRGIGNPIGIKVGYNANPSEIVEIAKKINPKNIKGKVSLIIRMGKDKINEVFDDFLKIILQSGISVNLLSDPMHGNTYLHNGIKVRNYNDILSELTDFFCICRNNGIEPNGVHLELTSENVTECIGGLSGIDYNKLNQNYTSLVDPRLNAAQGLELAFAISKLINQNNN